MQHLGETLLLRLEYPTDPRQVACRALPERPSPPWMHQDARSPQTRTVESHAQDDAPISKIECASKMGKRRRHRLCNDRTDRHRRCPRSIPDRTPRPESRLMLADGLAPSSRRSVFSASPTARHAPVRHRTPALQTSRGDHQPSKDRHAALRRAQARECRPEAGQVHFWRAPALRRARLDSSTFIPSVIDKFSERSRSIIPSAFRGKSV